MQRRCWRYGAAPTPVDDEPWPETTEFSKVANDAVYGCGVRDRVPALDSGRTLGPTATGGGGPPRGRGGRRPLFLNFSITVLDCPTEMLINRIF